MQSNLGDTMRTLGAIEAIFKDAGFAVRLRWGTLDGEGLKHRGASSACVAVPCPRQVSCSGVQLSSTHTKFQKFSQSISLHLIARN